MFKREFKVNFKSLCIWTTIISLFYLVVYIIYPLLINDTNLDMMNQLMESIDPSILKIFNMDISSISKVSGWLYSEGFTMLTIFISLYAAILGSNILLKEEDEKTIEYLYSKPITRKKIVSVKLFVGIINIIIFSIFVFLVNLIGLMLSNDLEFNKLIVISSLQLLTCIPVFVITLFISTLCRKTKTSLMISMGFVFINYFINIISLLGEKVEFFKYFSLFTLSSYREYLISNNINYISILISIFITVIFSFGTYYIYDKKEFL